jgi:hypothetical protein
MALLAKLALGPVAHSADGNPTVGSDVKAKRPRGEDWPKDGMAKLRRIA